MSKYFFNNFKFYIRNLYFKKTYDQEMMELGYDYYDRTHTGKEVSYFKEFREVLGEEFVDRKGEEIFDDLTKLF